MTNPTPSTLPVQEPAGAVEAKRLMMAYCHAVLECADRATDQRVKAVAKAEGAMFDAIDRLASLPPVTQAKSEAVADTYERYSAIRESHYNGVIDEYFQAREGWTLMPHGIFRDALYRGFDARDNLSPESALYAAPQEAVERPDGAGYFKRDAKGRWAQVNPADWILPGVVPLFLQPKIESAPAPQEAVERQPLTEDEISDITDRLEEAPTSIAHAKHDDIVALVRAIERHFGIGPATQEKQHG